MFRFFMFPINIIAGVFKVLMIVAIGLMVVGYSTSAMAEVRNVYIPRLLDKIESHMEGKEVSSLISDYVCQNRKD